MAAAVDSCATNYEGIGREDGFGTDSWPATRDWEGFERDLVGSSKGDPAPKKNECGTLW
jgi:hypothetical protein